MGESIKKRSDTNDSRNDNGSSEPQSGIGRRIEKVAGLLGTRKCAASIAGVSEDMLYRYIREENPPRFDAMARLCAAANMSLDWLALGDEVAVSNSETHQYESLGRAFERALLDADPPDQRTALNILNLDVKVETRVVMANAGDSPVKPAGSRGYQGMLDSAEGIVRHHLGYPDDAIGGLASGEKRPDARKTEKS